MLETRRGTVSHCFAYSRYAKIHIHQSWEQKDERVESKAQQSTVPVFCLVATMSLSRLGTLYLELTRTRSHFPEMHIRRNGN